MHLITLVPGASMNLFPFCTLVILIVTSQAVAQECDNKGCALHTMLIVGKGITIIQNFSHFGTYDLWPTNLWPRSLDLPILLLLALKLSSLAASKLAQSVRARPSVVPCWPGPCLLPRPGGVLQLLALCGRLCHQPRVPGQIIHLYPILMMLWHLGQDDMMLWCYKRMHDVIAHCSISLQLTL